MRNFELMESEIAFPQRSGSVMFPQVAASIRKASSFRTLVVWAAGAIAGTKLQVYSINCRISTAYFRRSRAFVTAALINVSSSLTWNL
jgi:hypothetical protein